MPTLYQLKPKFQQLLRPLLHRLHGVGVSANAVTVTAMGLSMLLGSVLWYFPRVPVLWLLLPVFLLLRMALNAIDGMLAREFNQQSRVGAILNEVGDVVSDCFLYVPFGLIYGVSFSLVLLIVLLAILSEFIGVLGQVIGGGRRYDGPMGKSDRAFVFGALALLNGVGLICNLGWLFDYFWNPLLWLVLLALALTLYNRARQALHAADYDAALAAAADGGTDDHGVGNGDGNGGSPPC